MFFDLSNKKEDGGPDTLIHLIAVPCISAGIFILAAPNFRDLILRYLDKLLGTKLDFAQSPWTGWGLVVIGVAIYIIERLVVKRVNKTFLAFRHQSFSPISNDLASEDLPKRLKYHQIQTVNCDISPYFKAGVAENLQATIIQQLVCIQRIVANKVTLSTAELGYYGIVHIPFQFLAGFNLSTFVSVHLFELERNSAKWKELSRQNKSSVSFKREVITNADSVEDVVIRISISYKVTIEECREVVKKEFWDASIELENPRIDSILSYQDVFSLCENFREIIDRPDIRSKTLHIFYAGPVSLGFSLGQRISDTIHGQVFVYNRTEKTSPKYAWNINLSNEASKVHVRHF
jgi:hypothetical protein